MHICTSVWAHQRERIEWIGHKECFLHSILLGNSIQWLSTFVIHAGATYSRNQNEIRWIRSWFFSLAIFNSTFFSLSLVSIRSLEWMTVARGQYDTHLTHNFCVCVDDIFYSSVSFFIRLLLCSSRFGLSCAIYLDGIRMHTTCMYDFLNLNGRGTWTSTVSTFIIDSTLFWLKRRKEK